MTEQLISQNDFEAFTQNDCPINYIHPQYIPDITNVLDKNGITANDFILLICAVFLSVEKGRKIFISLTDTANNAFDVSCALYSYIPFALRKKLVFAHFSDTVAPDVAVYFMPDDFFSDGDDAVNIGEHNASRDFIFDFCNKKILHASSLNDVSGSEFLELIQAKLKDTLFLADFFDFAQSVTAHLTEARKLPLRLYDDLTLLYSVENQSLSTLSGRIAAALGDMLVKGTDNPSFFVLYDKYIDRVSEVLAQEQLSATAELLKLLVMHFPHLTAASKNKVLLLLANDLSRCIKHDNFDLLFSHMDIIKSENELYTSLITDYFSSHPKLLNTYFTYLLSRQRTIHALFDFIDKLIAEQPQLLSVTQIQEMLHARALDLYATTGDRYVALKYSSDKTAALCRKYPSYADWFDSIYFSCLNSFYESFSIYDLAANHILNFPPRGVEKLSSDAQLKNRIVLALKEIMLMMNDQTMSFIHYDAFGFEHIKDKLCTDEAVALKAEALLKEKLLSLTASHKGIPKRLSYTFALYACESRIGRISYDFDKLMRYLETELNADVLDFITWFVEGGLFIQPQMSSNRPVRAATGSEPDMNILVDFLTAVLSYYRRHGELLTDKYYVQKLRKTLNRIKTAHPAMAECYKGFQSKLTAIIHENYSAIRLMLDYLEINTQIRNIILSVLVTAVIAAGAAIAVNVSLSDDDMPMPSAAPSERKAININRSAWSAKIIKLDGTVLPSSFAINDYTDDLEVFDMSTDGEICVSLGLEDGAVIDGISILYGITDPNTTLTVSVVTDSGKKLSLSVSDYDMENSMTIYLLPKAMSIKEIHLTRPETAPESGISNIKEINAFIMQ